MRRTDKETLDRTRIDAIIRACEVCHLAFAGGDEPYVVPISFGYDGDSLFFHSARQGTKIDFIDRNPRVCFEMVRNVRIVTHDTDSCKWTFSFESVVGFGEIEELLSLKERIAGLNQIMRQYSGKDWDFNQAMLKQTCVWRLRIESVTGKCSEQKAL